MRSLAPLFFFILVSACGYAPQGKVTVRSPASVAGPEVPRERWEQLRILEARYKSQKDNLKFGLTRRLIHDLEREHPVLRAPGTRSESPNPPHRELKNLELTIEHLAQREVHQAP